MIIDSLAHVTPDGKWFSTHCDASEVLLLQQMDGAGVDRAALVALAGVITNEFVLEAYARHPDRFIPCASFDPSAYESGKNAARELRVQLRGALFRALKLHPRLNRYDLLDARCLAILEEIASWDPPMPVWVCSLLHHPCAPLTKSLVDTLHTIAVTFPRLTFVFCHAGGAYALQLAQAVRSCSNVFLDLSYTVHHQRDTSVWMDLRYLVKTFDRQIVWGSDFPEVSVGETMSDLQALLDGLSEEMRKNILGRNVANILGVV